MILGPCRRRRQAVVACAALALFAARARADDSPAAQALFDQGKKAMANKDYAHACPKLEESLRLEPALGTLLNLADCYEHAGKLASAWSKFLEVSSKARAAGQSERARIGRDRAAALLPKLSSLVVSVPAPSRVEGLVVRRDRTVVGDAEWDSPIPADAGEHLLEASAPGHKTWSQTLTVADGAKTTTVTVPALEVDGGESSTQASAPSPEPAPAGVFGAAPPAPPPSSKAGHGQRTVAMIAGAVGAAGLLAGGVFGALSLVKHSAANTDCPGPQPCTTQAGVDEHQDAYTFGNVSTVAFVAGGAVLATAAVLWFTAPKGANGESGASLAIGPTGFRVTGAW